MAFAFTTLVLVPSSCDKMPSTSLDSKGESHEKYLPRLPCNPEDELVKKIRIHQER